LDIDGSTATATMGASEDAGFAARVIALGRRGCSRAEIGPALGLEMAELAAREAG
jgi:hypothetical protein